MSSKVLKKGAPSKKVKRKGFDDDAADVDAYLTATNTRSNKTYSFSLPASNRDKKNETTEKKVDKKKEGVINIVTKPNDTKTQKKEKKEKKRQQLSTRIIKQQLSLLDEDDQIHFSTDNKLKIRKPISKKDRIKKKEQTIETSEIVKKNIELLQLLSSH